MDSETSFPRTEGSKNSQELGDPGTLLNLRVLGPVEIHIHQT